MDFFFAEGALDLALAGGSAQGAQIALQQSRAVPGASLALELGDEHGVSLAPFGPFLPGGALVPAARDARALLRRA